MKRVVGLVATIAACGGAVQANVGIARSPEQGAIEYLWAEPAGNAHYPIVLYLDGSDCRSVTNVVAYARPILELGMAIVLPEKRGVHVDDDGARCSQEFLQTNDRAQRIASTVTVVEHLRPRLSRWDGRIVVLGASEGGALAPAVALALPTTVAVISLAGGGKSQFHELLELASSDEERNAIWAKREEILGDPTPNKTWLGPSNTYKRWASWLDAAPLDDFLRVKVPIYVAHGHRDTSVPVASATEIQTEFRRVGKGNLDLRLYPSLDHNWRDQLGRSHAREVVADMTAWLATHVER